MPGSRGSTVKSLRFTVSLLSGLCLGLLFAANAACAQNAPKLATAEPGASAQPKYRTHFMVYDVQKKTTKTILTVDGEFHAPNWTPDGKYIFSDMGGELYRIPMSGDKAGKPEKVKLSQKMMATNDHALSWDGKHIAITGIVRPISGTVRSAADIHNPLFISNIDGSNATEVHLGWLHGWAPDGKYVVYTQFNRDNFDLFRINADGSGETQLTANKGQDDGPEYRPTASGSIFARTAPASGMHGACPRTAQDRTTNWQRSSPAATRRTGSRISLRTASGCTQSPTRWTIPTIST